LAVSPAGPDLFSDDTLFAAGGSLGVARGWVTCRM
jgi:hypothetical protein